MAPSFRMVYFSILLALGLDAFAITIPRQAVQCTFSITSTGPPDGVIKQDTTGGLRIGDNYPQVHYLLENGTLTDEQNNTCIIDGSSSQFYCAPGVTENTNFGFSDGLTEILHNGSDKWLACPDTDGSSTIFSDKKEDATGCTSVMLRAGGFGCAALGRPDPTSTTTTATLAPRSAPTTSTAPGSASSQSEADCPVGISSEFQFPHLIVPTSPESPDLAFGNSYKAYISPSNTTLFNFDIPATAPYTGTCSLIFLFPYASELDPSAGGYYFSGTEAEEGQQGGIEFAVLSGVASADTTYNTTPAIATDFGKTEIIPGTNYTVAIFPCQSGKAISVSASSKGGVELDYFQDSAPSPIGLYIVPCA